MTAPCACFQIKLGTAKIRQVSPRALNVHCNRNATVMSQSKHRQCMQNTCYQEYD